MFEDGKFTSHSGVELNWKINCDSLTQEDWACIAKRINEAMHFKRVIGIPNGGLKLAEALEKYVDPSSYVILVVDDVLTTGNSMLEMKQKLMEEEKIEEGMIRGVVLYLRGDIDHYWIKPVFELTHWFVG